jgi:hypothetical protein
VSARPGPRAVDVDDLDDLALRSGRPVRVRAARIDGPGTAAASFAYTGGPRDGGHYAVLTHPDSAAPAAE